MDILDLVGDFTWDFGQSFFIETAQGNFVWSDPSYNGDNTLKRFNGNLNDWYKDRGVPFGRDKGQAIIRNRCGNDVKVVQ